MPAQVRLLLQDIRKSIQDAEQQRLLLDGINLSLNAGEFVGITGPSGAGKSTLMNIMSAIEYPDSGQVVLDGKPFQPGQEAYNTRLRRRHIGLVFQFFNLVPTLSVRENLLLPLALNRLDDGEAHVDQLMERLGLKAFASSLPTHLSGGEQQRVGVARALIHNPGVILADEPTGSLDSTSGELVLDMLRAAADDGSTVCMVTHSDKAVARCDHVYYLEEGKLTLV